MIEIEDIVDRDSLKEWLTHWPASQGLDEYAAHQIAITIAYRAAMRVMPVWWAWSQSTIARKKHSTEPSVLRNLLVTKVSALKLTPELILAAARSSSTTKARFDSANSFAAKSARKAAATVTAHPHFATAAATAVENSLIDVIPNVRLSIWASVRGDCLAFSKQDNAFTMLLWGDQNNPIAALWADVKVQATEPKWAFWIKWYDDVLAGRGENLDLLEKIALIEPEVWESGTVAVAAEIAKIELKYRAENRSANQTPEQAITQNTKVISLQFDTLRLLIEEEIARLRAPNFIADDIMVMIILLEKILCNISAMQSALIDGIHPSTNALAVIEEHLPQVFEAADELAKDDDTPEVSEMIVMMGTNIDYLTKRGTPGYLATGIAAADIVKSSVRGWFNRAKISKDVSTKND